MAKILRTCEDESILGAPFYLMQRLDGRVFNDSVDVAHLDEAQSLACSHELMDVLARLHAVEPGQVGLEGFGKPSGFVERQVRRWTMQWQKGEQRTVPEIDEVARRLIAARQQIFAKREQPIAAAAKPRKQGDV